MSLLHAIEVCLKFTNVPPSRFGRDSVRDPRLVHDLRRGRQPGRRMEKRVRAHMAGLLAEMPENERLRAERRIGAGGSECA